MLDIQVLPHPYFNESLSRHRLSTEYTDRLAGLPDGWTWYHDKQWVQVQAPESKILVPHPVAQGFKIHVSSTPRDALRALDIVVRLCVQHTIDFKFAGDPALHYLLNSKMQPRGHSGKFITIYPPDELTFKTLIEDLYGETRAADLKGPRILSDRQYKDSPVLFYRFGGFHSPRRVNADGTYDSCLVSPEGHLIPDKRLPYFELPSWVKDPFGMASPLSEQDVLIGNRYRIETAVAFSNAGGLYYGSDAYTKQQVFVKEARPYTNCYSMSGQIWDAVYFLKHEYDILCRCADLTFIPNAIELVEDGGHTFLIEERIDGVSLRDYWAMDNILLAPYIRLPGRIDAWVPRFKHIAQTLIEMVSAMHDHGVLIGDVSPDNVMISPSTLDMWIIDFESAVAQAEDNADMSSYSALWATPGYSNPKRRSRNELTADDDFYGVAMILYGFMAPVNPLFALNPIARPRFLNEFIKLGVPVNVKEIIDSLMSGDWRGAREVVAAWDD